MQTAVILSVSDEMIVCLDSVLPLSLNLTLGVNPPSCTMRGEAAPEPLTSHSRTRCTDPAARATPNPPVAPRARWTVMGLPAKASAPMMKALLTAAGLGFLTGIMLLPGCALGGRGLCTSRSGLAEGVWAVAGEEVAGVEEAGEVELEPTPARLSVAARMFSSRNRSLAAPTSARQEQHA